jgi:exonuclease SbcC
VRPVELTVEGFTCFRRRTPISFADLGVFAISGATGSGKTSLIDAMIFALYGKVPRVGKGCVDLISTGLDRMSVRLVFRVGSREFVVARALRRGAAGQAQLDELGTSLAHGVREVDEQIENLLGMPFDTFTQSVVLPQGDFAKFLGSKAKDRMTLLQDLLRLGIYSRMREAAGRNARDLAQETELLSQQMGEVSTGASPEAVEALVVDREASAAANLARAKAISALDLRVAEMRGIHAKCVELADMLARQTRFLARAPEIARLRLEREEAERALRVQPSLRELAAAHAEVLRLQGDLAASEQTLGDAARARAVRVETLKQAKLAATETPAVRKRVAALDGVLAVAHQLASERRLLRDVQATRQRTISGSKQAEKDFRAAEKRERDYSEALRAATERVSQIGYDPERAEALEGSRELLERARDQRSGLVRDTRDAERAESAATIAEEATAKAAAALQSAKEQQASAKTVLEAATSAREEAREKDHARALRAELAVGEPCPVCEQTVKVRPRAIRSTDLDVIERRVERAAVALESAREGVASCDLASKELRGRLEENRAEAREIRDRMADRQRDLQQVLRKVERVVGRLVADEEGDDVSDRARSLLAKLAKIRSAHDEATAHLAAAQRVHAEACTRAALSRGLVDKSQAEAKAAAEACSAVERRIEEWDARVRAVTEHEDPAQEREQLWQRAEALEHAVAQAREAEQRETARAEACRVAYETALARTNEAKQREVLAANAATAEASANGFEGLEAARTATRDAARMKALEGQLAQAQQEQSTVANRVAALELELGERRVSTEELGATIQELSDVREKHIVENRRDEALAKEVEAMRERLRAMDALRARREDADGRRTLQAQLARDLTATAFPQFLLRGTLRELVERASVRLHALSREQYTLVLHEDEFHVVDGDAGNSMRPASTLSGGETFLASLALALELAEQVQREAGAVHLDSLFVDEGFATLDQEALDVAAQAIESLQGAGGRMVGIVTHLQELTERLPARLLVSKETEGAVVKIEQW